MAFFTISGLWRIYYFWPFSPILDSGEFIISGVFNHFRTLTDLLFPAVFTISGLWRIYYFWPF